MSLTSLASLSASTMTTSPFSSTHRPSSTSLPSSISATATTHHPASSTTGSGGGGGGGGAGANSPLLFFVALGFGVVFTNLWIIVGVKYCFRYNSRQRALRAAAENGEPIDLGAVPGRPHRRRREKKLMSMEEVNERFPLIKYKLWRARRENEGLPAAGGVAATSRAASLRDEDGVLQTVVIGDSAADALDETGPVQTHSVASPTVPAHVDAATPPQDSPAAAAALDEKHRHSMEQQPVADEAGPATITHDPLTHDSAEDEELDPIQQAVPSELLAQPGDACAICIDNLDDEDEVRGLTCGHAFHAGCLDPWLTSRRACCPLCKHDYYIPKPRPEAADVNPADPTAGATPQLARIPPELPAPIWLSTLGASRFGRGATANYQSQRAATLRAMELRANSQSARGGQGRRRHRSQGPAVPAPAPATVDATSAAADTPAPRSRFRIPTPSLSVPSMLRRTHTADAADATSESATATTAGDSPVTPSQLEAGHQQR